PAPQSSPLLSHLLAEFRECGIVAVSRYYWHSPRRQTCQLQMAAIDPAGICQRARHMLGSRKSKMKRGYTAYCSLTSMHERGVQFVSDRSFYRAESAQARDLAVLAVSVFKSRSPDQPFRVLDVMAGSGVRGARYLQQAGVDAVWCNDHNSSVHNELVMNLCGGVAPLTAEGIRQQVQLLDASAEVLQLPGLKRQAGERQGPPGPSVRVSHMDAQRLLAACYLAEDFYDLIDIDSFGSDTSFLGSALDALKHGGLLFLTSTDGFSSAGLRPTHSLAAYGAYLRALPCANEQGLRMLIGAAVREGASRGLALSPVFSLYSYHGPVFRVMLRATRSALWPAQHYAFLAHCHLHGTTRAQHWRHLSDAVCRCEDGVEEGRGQEEGRRKRQGQEEGQGLAAVCCHCQCITRCNEGKPGVRPTPLVLSGPLWTGPLHCAKVVGEMEQEAARRGWNGHSWSTSGSAATPDAGEPGAQPGSPPTTHATPGSRKHKARPLEALLALLLEESDPRLPPGFLPLDVLGRHLVRFPQRDQLIQQLRDAGFAAARCHLDDKALRTNASFQACMAAARSLGIAAREDDS
ncbi:hypothetical protein QJQ45_027967, partial [Haematococcus lacustris]